MINIKQRNDDSTATVTFSLDTTDPVSVIGDFNGWDCLATPLVKGSNGLCSTSVEVPVGSQLRFRYLADPGRFFDDEDADWLEPNGFGESHSVVVAQVPTAQ